MKLTNKFGLPEPVVRALSFDNYSKGDADYSVTQLLDSPRIRALQWAHKHEIEQDVTDNFFSLLGRACHQILEWGGEKTDGATAEERLFLTIDVDGVPITISGSMDLQEESVAPRPPAKRGVTISDYKVTSVLSATADKASWEQQLNLYAHLVRETKGARVVGLQIVVFLRDWRKSASTRDPSYPKSPILVLPIKLWKPEQAAHFLQDRVRLHVEAGEAVLSGEMPSPCTTEERWEGEASFAVMKTEEAKRASKVFSSLEEAQKYAIKLGDEAWVDARWGEPRRCLGNWCKVAQFCDYGRKLMQENNEEDFC